MQKTTIFAIIALIITLSLTACDDGSNNPGGNDGNASDFRYTEANGEITITGYIGAGGNVTIPSKIDGKPVTSIGRSAFYQCTSLAAVTIPDSVTSIGDYAFFWCFDLTAVTIGKNVNYIGESSFYGCGFTNVTIPYSVTHIGKEAFSSCLNLTTINVAAQNTTYTSQDGVLYKNKTDLIAYPAGKTTASFTIPNNVTSIWDSAFRDCNSLTAVTIPNSVTSIGDWAFEGCYNLASINIPDNVASIGGFTFISCRSLTEIIIPGSVKSIGQQAFDYCDSLTSVTFVGTIPASSFSYSVFYGDLKDKFYATDPDNGTPGTYTTTAPLNWYSSVWTKQ